MRPVEDLTARARIRDAALAHFAEHGVRGATLRAIAEEAGVSLGLVQHHFGSKDGLREACDAYVLEFVKLNVHEALDEHRLDEPEFVSEVYRAGPPVMLYLSRALADGSPGAAVLFDDMVAVTERFLGDRPDVRAQAAVFTAMKLGVHVLRAHVARAMGADPMSAEGAPRVSAAMLEIVSPSFTGSELADQARDGLDRYRKEQGR